MIKGIVAGRPVGSEQGIVTAILHYLVSLRLRPVHHRNTGSIRGKNGDGTLRFGLARSSINQKGAPDILVTVDGFGVAIEVKSAVGRLRPEQVEWLQAFQSMPTGGLVVVARSVDDVVAAVERLKRGERWMVDLKNV